MPLPASTKSAARGFIQAGPGIKVVHTSNGYIVSAAKGRTTSSAPGALTLTLTPPPGYVPAAGDTAQHIFVTWGTVGTVIVEALFSAPVLTLAANATSTTYIWAKVTIDAAQPFLVKAVAWANDTDAGAHPTEAFSSDGVPPATVYIPMGKITAVAGVVTLQNSGSGSLVLALHNTGEQFIESSTLIVSRGISYWRTGSANE